MSKTIEVKTDAAATPKLTLTMKGTIEVLAAFERGSLDFGRVPMGETRTETVGIEAKDRSALKLSGLTVSDASILKAELVEERPAVKVTFTAGSEPRMAGGVVRVDTNVPGAGQLTLQVRAKVAGDLDVTPPTAVLSPFEKGQPAPEITLRITSVGGKPFHLLRIEDPEGALGGTVAPQGGSWLARVIARKAPKADKGTIYLVTDRKDQPRLPIPYQVSDPTASAAKAAAMRNATQGRPMPPDVRLTGARPVGAKPAAAVKPALAPR